MKVTKIVFSLIWILSSVVAAPAWGSSDAEAPAVWDSMSGGGATLTLSGAIAGAPASSGEMSLAFDFFDPSTKLFVHRSVATVSYLNGGYVATVATGALQPGASYIVAASAPGSPPQSPDAAPNSYVRLQATTPGTQQVGHINISGKIIAGMFQGDGSLLTNLNASNLATGTVPGARLSGTYANALTLSNAANSFTGVGAGLTGLNASNLATGIVSPARVSGSYTGITGVGTLTAGTWQATPVASAFGGTGINTSAAPAGSLLRTTAPGTWATLAPGTAGQVLTMVSGLPAWSTPSGGGTVTSISQGTGIVLSPNPITTTGSVAVDPAAVALLGTAQTFTGAKTFSTAPSFTAAGVPFNVASTTKVTNLNADLLDGLNSTAFQYAAGAGLSLTGNTFSITTGGVATAMLANLAVTDAKVNDVAWGKITGAPTSFPPGGPAGGDLTGAYPNPTIALGAVNTGEIANAAVTGPKVAVPLSLTGALAGDSVIRGTNLEATALSFGIWGEGASTDGRGVVGLASATTGQTSGVHGRSLSTVGYGVFGDVTATSGVNYGVFGRSQSTSGFGVYGHVPATSGITHGVTGRSESTSGRGVFGEAAAASGQTFGVIGISESTLGLGVYGEARATTGATFGVAGRSFSTSGYGVQGVAEAASGTTYGVQGRSASTGGYGVFGDATATTGFTRGVQGRSSSSSGVGVFGEAIAATGQTFGLFGRSGSTSGAGVEGEATTATGVTYGVFGQSASASGTGVSGVTTATSGTTYGVFGQSASTGGLGVFGGATATTGFTRGVQGRSSSSSGVGVFGEATAATGQTFGLFGRSNSTSGAGVEGEATTATGVTYGVFGQSNSATGYGVYSNGDLHVAGDFTATGSKAGYVTDLVLNGGSQPLEAGDVVEIVGHEQAVVGDIPVIVVRKAQTANSRAVLGPVDCAVQLTPKEESEENAKLPARLRHEAPQFHVHKTDGPIQPGGYGRAVTLGSFKSIKVDASFGAIQPGDLLVSSPNAGYAMKAAPIGFLGKEPVYAQGAVIGKALGPLASGVGVIPVLVQSR